VAAGNSRPGGFALRASRHAFLLYEPDLMTFNFHQMTAQHSTGMHFASFGAPVTLHTSAGETLHTSAICKVSESEESTNNEVGVIVRAELVIPDTLNGAELLVRSPWTLEFRNQKFSIESLSPPVAGFIKINAMALTREITNAVRGR